ncbi:MAG TPA: ABC transporter permease [Solirubrobacteraceae bacterium]|jgi:ABC-type nitrate/sulfonate/bicarbonate transport system permease component|nr:ABC transporter permease [Solirubrobacteraceae bacterium]
MDAGSSVVVSRIAREIGRPSCVTRLPLGWGLAVALMVVWQVIGNSGSMYYLPPFTTVMSHVWGLMHGSNLTQDVLPSIGRAVGGYVLGCGLGLLVGVAIGYFRALDPWVKPVLEFFRALPAPIAVSLGLLLLGFSTMTRIYAIAFGCFFAVVINAADGARRVDQQLIDTARVAGMSRPRTLFAVVLPASLPQAVAGLRLAVSLALIGMVISELLGSSSGLGYFITNAQNNLDYPDVWAAVVVLGILGWLFTALFGLGERRMLRWHHEQREVSSRA